MKRQAVAEGFVLGVIGYIGGYVAGHAVGYRNGWTDGVLYWARRTRR